MKRFLLKEWAKRISKNNWDRLVFTYSNDDFRTGEVTLTENLLFEFYQIASKFRLPVRLYEARDERNKGNDIELAIETEFGYLLLPCQAKIIRNNRVYNNIGYISGNSGQRQIDLLIKYAEDNGAIPVYLLYNGILDYDVFESVQKEINFGIDKYGCSIALAEDLREQFVDQAISPRFEDLHPNLAIPFYQVFDMIYRSFNAVPMLAVKEDKVTFYNLEDLTRKDEWKNMAPPPSIGGFPIALKSSKYGLHEGKYSPKYRMFFSRDSWFNKMIMGFFG